MRLTVIFQLTIPLGLTDYAEWQTKEGLPGIVEESPDANSHIPSWRKVEDYCPIRHRVAIVRVLKAINGHGLLLNSAVRLWTVAQVAISLDVPQVVVSFPIFSFGAVGGSLTPLRSTPLPNGLLRHRTQSSSRSAQKRPSSWPTLSRSRVC